MYRLKATNDKVQTCKKMQSDHNLVVNDKNFKNSVEDQKLKVATDESEWLK